MAANTSVAVPTDRAIDPAVVARFFVSESDPIEPKNGDHLENYANNSARPQKSPEDRARIQRWEARAFLWRESQNKRVRTCGRYSVLPDQTVQVRSNGVAVGFAGLATCGSVWACPVCNSKINAVRRLEMGVMIATCQSEGGSLAFGARTLRHNASQALGPLMASQSQTWNAVTVDLSTRKLRKELGFIGYSRAAEVTIGKNGWHPHVHPLYFFNRQVTPKQIEQLQAVEFSAWANKAVRLGLEAPLDIAQHMHLVSGEEASEQVGKYFTKAGMHSADSVAWELTSSQTKTGRQFQKTISPWVLLSGARSGDADALDLWHEYERSSKGKRALTHSRGLRSRFGLLAEATDEEIVEAEIGSSEDAVFDVADWAPVRRRPSLGPNLLSAVKRGGMSAGKKFCAKNGIEIIERNV